MDWNIDRIMAVAGIGLGILALLLGLGATLAMDAKTKGELRFAYGCFVVSSLMLFFSVGIWGMRTDASLTKRVAIVTICSAIICICLIESLRWAKQRHEVPRPQDEQKVAAQVLPKPSLVFVFGVPLGDNDSASWMMTLHHYGPSIAHNCKIDFYDQDRINIQHQWLLAHPNSPFPPPGLTGDSRDLIYIPEAGPERSAGSFPWNPLYPDRQHYTVNIECRDGVFTETWEVTRVDGILRSRITIERGAQWIAKNPNQDPVVFKLDDPEFVSTQLATEVPKSSPGKIVHPGWKPNHRFEIPAAILDPNGNLQVMAGIKLPDGSTLTDFGCWNILTKHFGDDPKSKPEYQRHYLESKG